MNVLRTSLCFVLIIAIGIALYCILSNETMFHHDTKTMLRHNKTMSRHNKTMSRHNETMSRHNKTMSRHENETMSRYENETMSRYENETMSRYENETISHENETMSRYENETMSRYENETIFLNCSNETMFRHHERVLTVCPNSGSFIGEKDHKLWWDEDKQYWFCGMNNSKIALIDSGKIVLPLLFNSAIKTTPDISTANASLRDGRETLHYRNKKMVVIAIQGIPPHSIAPETLGVAPIDGLAVDIDFYF